MPCGPSLWEFTAPKPKISWRFIKGLPLPLRSGLWRAGHGIIAPPSRAGRITASNPFPPLPGEFQGKYLALRFHFYYNPDKSDLQ